VISATWQNIPVTNAVWDWLAERGYSTHRMPKSKREDAESILGPELAEELEKAEMRLKGFEVRVAGAPDPTALVFKDEHEPGVNPVSLLIESDDFQMALHLIQPLLEIAIINIINSQMSPNVIIAEAGQIASVALHLKEGALTVIIEASKLAQAQLLATSPAANPQELERATKMLMEFLKSTHFTQRAIEAGEDSAEAMSASQRRMLALVKPSIDQVPEVTAVHLAELVTSVVTEIVEGVHEGAPIEERKMQIPSAEYGSTQSAHNVTPNLRSLVRQSVYTPAVLAQLGQTPAPAPQLVQQRREPVSTGGLSLAQIQQAVQLAISPIAAEIVALKARSASVTRSTHRRAAAAPQVSRSAVAGAMGGGGSRCHSDSRIQCPRRPANATPGIQPGASCAAIHGTGADRAQFRSPTACRVPIPLSTREHFCDSRSQGPLRFAV
jgi:hypothetical protein